MSTIIVASSAGRAKKVSNFNGETWGELKRHADVAPLVVGDLEVIINPGNIAVRGDDSILPEGDFNVYLVPTKNKAGVSETAVRNLGREIAEALVSAASKAGDDDLSELRDAIISDIEDFFGVDVERNSDNDDDVKAAIAAAQKLAPRR